MKLKVGSQGASYVPLGPHPPLPDKRAVGALPCVAAASDPDISARFPFCFGGVDCMGLGLGWPTAAATSSTPECARKPMIQRRRP